MDPLHHGTHDTLAKGSLSETQSARRGALWAPLKIVCGSFYPSEASLASFCDTFQDVLCRLLL
jgi:hypothetical protein